MTAATYGLTFNGYWRVPNISGIPAASGVYVVDACTHNVLQGTVSLRQLLYVGEAGNLRDRVACHERWDDWYAYLLRGEELCFSAALIAPTSDRQRAEAAIIRRHQPPCNTEYMYAFPYGETTLVTSGENALMTPICTVEAQPLTSLAALLGVASRR